MSAAVLSKQAGYSSSYVSKVENGQIEPSIMAFSKISKILGLKDHEIIWLVRVLGANAEMRDKYDKEEMIG